MFKSIRWTLLFWYGLILVVILTGFGAALYHHLRRAMHERFDARLGESARVIFGAVLSQRRGRPEIRLPESQARRFRGSEPDAPYYVVWDHSGAVVAQSNPAIAVPPPAAPRPPVNPRGTTSEGTTPHAAADGRRHHDHPEGFGGPPQGAARARGPYREIIRRGPRGLTVLVGQRNDDEGRRLGEFLGMMVAAGAGMLGVALLGGWFLAGRALAPIERISAAASGISASNLSRRINVEKTESELGRLATILNVTFDRLEAAFLRQAQFTADASHELRTPLAIMIAHAELALRRDRSTADYRGTIETCLKAARRMESVVEGLLALARADANELELRRDRVDWSLLVEESVTLLQPLAALRQLVIQVDAEPIELDGDEERLQEVVTNLLKNAISYNRDGGTIAIRLWREQDHAILTVADTGIGIPEADLPHVFERFYRANAARSREAGGNGLGLAIATWIVEAHGGSIGVTSREGLGTTFTVILPAASVREGPPTPSRAIARK